MHQIPGRNVQHRATWILQNQTDSYVSEPPVSPPKVPNYVRQTHAKQDLHLPPNTKLNWVARPRKPLHADVLADQSHQEIHEGEDKADEGDVEKRNAGPADGKEGIHPPGIEAAGEVARDQKRREKREERSQVTQEDLAFGNLKAILVQKGGFAKE